MMKRVEIVRKVILSEKELARDLGYKGSAVEQIDQIEDEFIIWFKAEAED